MGKKRDSQASVQPLYNEVQAQFVRIGSRLRSSSGGSSSAPNPLRHFMKAPPGPFVSPLTVPGTPPSPPGSPVLSQPPYSRGGDPRQRATPALVPARLPYRVGVGGWRRVGGCAADPPSSLSDGCVKRPTGSLPQMRCTHFRSCVKNSRHSVDTVTSGGKLVQLRGGPRGRVSKRNLRRMLLPWQRCDFFFFRLLLLSGFENVVGEKNYFNPPPSQFFPQPNRISLPLFAMWNT